MKRIYALATALILLMALAIVGWGAWLNYSDENQIAKRMANRSVELTAARAARRPFAPVLSLDALRFSSEAMADAVTLTDGRIVRWHAGKNDNVRAGDVLVSLANENIPLRIQQAESAISRAESALAQAHSSYLRQGRLLERRATSQEKYETAEAQYLAAQGSLREAEAQRDQCLVQQDWLEVRSPLDGEVLIIYQREGAYVQAGTPIALVGDFSRLRFSMNMADVDVSHLEPGEAGYLSFPERKLSSKAYDTNYGVGNKQRGTEIKAVLKEIVPPLSEPADIRRTVWEVDNRARFLEPMIYTGVSMRAGSTYEVLTVPISAMADKANNKVFVVDGDGIIHERTVAAGAHDGKYIEIYEGLSEGEIVVVGNLDGLEEGMHAEVEMEGEA